MPSKSKMPLVALDTETTGGNFRRGDRPFSVALAWPGALKDIDNWETRFIYWPVDPHTRQVTPRSRDLHFLTKIIRTHRVVFHHAKFDIRALEAIGLDCNLLWRNYEDTLPASHVYDTGESHNLKDLARKYLKIPNDDERELQELVVHLRRIAKKKEWNIAKKVQMDYWLPYALGEGTELTERYNTLDAKRTIGLWGFYNYAMDKNDLWRQYYRERNLQPVIHRIEGRGVTLSRQSFKKEMKRYHAAAVTNSEQCERIVNRTHDITDFNIDSGQQVGSYLFDNLKQKVLTTTDSGAPSTSAPVLRKLYVSIANKKRRTKNENIAEEFIRNYLEYKLNNKSFKDCVGYQEKAHPFTVKLGRTPLTELRIHHSINQTGTRTTRCSHQDPNTGNVGKGKELEEVAPWLDLDDNDDEEKLVDFSLRKVFGPALKRMWYAIDYDQLQLRIFAIAAGEEKLVEGFRRGFDAHAMVACELYGLTMEEFNALDKDERTLKRRNAKTINFGFIFGMQPSTIEWRTGIKGLANQLRDLFPHLEAFKAEVDRQAKATGCVHTLGGYRIPVRWKRKWDREQNRWVNKHTGVCDIVQGTEGEIVKNAMIDVDRLLQDRTQGHAYITLQVHDELVFDFPYEENSQRWESEGRKKILREIMETMMKAGADVGVETPVSCEKIITNWAEGVKINKEILRRRGAKAEPYQLQVRPYMISHAYDDVTDLKAYSKANQAVAEKKLKRRDRSRPRPERRCRGCNRRTHGEMHRDTTGKPCPWYWSRGKWHRIGDRNKLKTWTQDRYVQAGFDNKRYTKPRAAGER